MFHRHGIQQIFHISLIQLNMPPEFINTDATFESMNFILTLKTHQKIVAVLFQIQIVTSPFVKTRIDVVLLEQNICHELVA